MVNRRQILKTLLINYHTYIDKAITIPENCLLFFMIHSSLLNLSYIYCRNMTSWIFFIVLLVRPSQFIQIQFFLIFAAIFVPLQLVFIINPNLPGSSQLSSINNLLKVSFLNFLLEQINDLFGLIFGSIILIIQGFEIVCVQWTLNINTKNFQTVEMTIFRLLKFLLDILLIVFYKLQFEIMVIQLISILDSLLSILCLFVDTTPKNQINIKLFFSIHLVTIYLGIQQFIYFENSFTLIIVPFFIKIIQVMRYQTKSSFQRDSIIQASYFLFENNCHMCLVTLYQTKEDNLLREVKKAILLSQCSTKFNISIMKQAGSFLLEGVTVRLLQNDQANLTISNEIQLIIIEKIKLLQNWKQITYEDIGRIIRKIQKTKHKVDKYYKIQPFGIIQSLTVFFYSEILNDIVEANELIVEAKKSAEALFKYHKRLSKLYYITAQFFNSTLIINKISSNTPKHFQHRQTINSFLPEGISKYHDKLIEQFLQTGYSKFVKNLGLNYIKNECYMDPIEFAIDITFTNKLLFICLFKPVNANNQIVLLLDDKYQIKAITKSVNKSLHLQSIFSLESQANDVIKELSQVKDNCIIENVNYYSHPVVRQRQSFVGDNLDLMSYFCDILINCRKIDNKIAYLFLELINLRNFSLSKKELTTITNFTSVSFEDIALEQEHKDLILIPKDENLENFKPMVSENLPYFTSREEDVFLLHKEMNNNQNFKKSIRSQTIYKNQHFFQNIEDNQKVIIEDEQKSQLSSVEFLRQSKFYRKYSLYNKFNKHMPLLKYHQILILFFIIGLFSQSIFIIIQQTHLNLVGFATDINLLEIKNLFFQPLDMFLMTRWNLWSYNYQLTHGIITLEQYNRDSEFSKSRLGEGYNALDSNLNSVLFKSELQTILESKFIEACQYTDTYKYDKYNMTLRNAIQVLLNFQYILKMNYVHEKTVSADSPQIFYSFKNYPLLRDIMTQLNSDIMIATLARGEQFQSDLVALFICQQILLFMSALVILLIRRYINKKLQLFLLFISYPQNEDLQCEIQRYNNILDSLYSDNSSLFNYQLKLSERETSFIKKKTERLTKNSKTFFHKKHLSLKQFITLSFIFYVIISINSIYNYFQYTRYLTKYPQTALYKKQLSDLGGDIPLMFAQREVLYGRINYIYLDNTYFTQIFQYIIESLNNTRSFTAADPDSSKMLMSSNFTSFYNKVAVTNLCNYLPDQSNLYLPDQSSLSLRICSTTMNGNMIRGLKTMLIYIQDLIETDMAINNFTYRASPTYNELEGAYMISEVINVINKQFYNDMIMLTTELVSQQNAFNILYLIGFIIIFFIIISIVRPILYNNSKNLLHFIYIIPVQTLFNEESVERTLRILINF